jgi:hypothetical protein
MCIRMHSGQATYLRLMDWSLSLSICALSDVAFTKGLYPTNLAHEEF